MTTKTKIDTRIITGPRKPFWAGPIKPSTPDGYWCDSSLLNGGYVWFAVEGRAVLVSETVVEAIAEDISLFNDLVSNDNYREALGYFKAMVKQDRQIAVAQIDMSQIETEGQIKYDLPVQPLPKNLAQALEVDYPGFEINLRDSRIGHKEVASLFPFTSETSVRRWRKTNGVEIAK